MLYHIAMREIKLSLLSGTMFPNMTMDQLQALGPIPCADIGEDIMSFFQEVKP